MQTLRGSRGSEFILIIRSDDQKKTKKKTGTLNVRHAERSLSPTSWPRRGFASKRSTSLTSPLALKGGPNARICAEVRRYDVAACLFSTDIYSV